MIGEWIQKLGGISGVITMLVPIALHILYAVIILIVGLSLARVFAKVVRKVMVSRKVEQTVVTFICRLVHALLVVFVVLAVLSKLGVQTASLVALLGAMGLAVGLSLRSSLSNLASGILLILFRPMKVGDFIEIGGVSGSVEEINILFTNIVSTGNQLLIIPNSKFMSDVITNFSKNKTRRNDLIIGVGYNDPLSKVKEVLHELVAADSRIICENDNILIAVTELADSSVNILVRYWTLRADYLTVKNDLIETIKNRFDQEGFNIPYPQMDVHVANISGDIG
jgi:small conductance mechanosensitive channel